MPEVVVITLPGPYGPFHVAATVHGVVAADWSIALEGFRARVARRLGIDRTWPDPPEPAGPAARRLAHARPTLEALLAGEPVTGADIAVDLADRPEWDQRVLLTVRQLGFGETASYGEIARRVGAPRAARAVGGAIGRNPLTLIVPCHRVIAADGTLGGYGGDGPFERHDSLERKRELLLREGVTVAGRAR